MADLGDIQTRLNSDKQFQQAFLNDPVGILQKEGITLSPQMEQDLRDLAHQAQAPKPAVAGSSVKGTAMSPGVSISISKNF